MEQDIVDRIASIIYSKMNEEDKHKASYEIAEIILKELNPDPPTWYIHG